MIDYIGGKLIAIRRADGGVTIRPLMSPPARPELNLSENEWVELIGLIQAVKAATDFSAEYGP